MAEPVPPALLTHAAPRVRHLRSLSAHGFHRVTWYEWGAPDAASVVVCVHGVSRNGRDFDVLGEALAPTHRVMAVDMPGRGQSDWLASAAEYAFPTYLTTLTALIAASGAESVSFVGTSMGGLLGMTLAAQPDTPVARLVINDVGPVLEPAALARIGTYLGTDPAFPTFGELEAHLRAICAPFGPLTDAQWTHLARTSARQDSAGRWRFNYDPAIATPFRTAAAPPDLWPLWDAIRCPTLVLRGAQSDLLSEATAHAMQARGPCARVLEIAGVGHAPALLDATQVAPIVEFLGGKPSFPGQRSVQSARA